MLAARIMRVLTAIGLCAEAGVAAYTANSKTKIMTLPQGITSFKTWSVTPYIPLTLHFAVLTG